MALPALRTTCSRESIGVIVLYATPFRPTYTTTAGTAGGPADWSYWLDGPHGVWTLVLESHWRLPATLRAPDTTVDAP